ncbi:hypothetical protein DPQ33_16890 [Oceanidesulfovibrio indonesiensis]|uniref:Uncharacterized protein n=1 Tax=Oceanidesulfovibrio indonesiensis TaxID=54767 RepID=A0A7M3MAH0_9BACT|nr:biotin/lipoyl-binding protein [Oceanidesulfovibrio indonesiensis]TVM14685.1 hypothetical protein DPQ33_16890 [Oceanidesulfovibrio indonesiensis]
MQIKPEINALVEGVHASEGSRVSPGQLLYILGAKTIQNELDSARAPMGVAVVCGLTMTTLLTRVVL